MNLCLDNPYGDVTIPRAKLRSPEDSSTVFANPLALDSANYGAQSNRNSALNPYGNFRPSGEDPSGTGLQSQDRSAQNASPYQGNYTVKEEEEEVGRCYSCCRRCRKK